MVCQGKGEKQAVSSRANARNLARNGLELGPARSLAFARDDSMEASDDSMEASDDSMEAYEDWPAPVGLQDRFNGCIPSE
jgi:hypothetical protein